MEIESGSGEVAVKLRIESNAFRPLGSSIYYETRQFILHRISAGKRLLRTKEVSGAEYDLAHDLLDDRILMIIPDGERKRMAYERISSWNQTSAEILLSHLDELGEGLSSVLDVGCGEGHQLLALSKNAQIHSLTGLDYSLNRIRHARKRLDDNGSRLLVGSADQLPFDDDSIDIIHTRHALEQMPLILDSVLKEFYRVCRVGIILIEPFYSMQNIFGKFHNNSLHYAQDIPEVVRQSDFEIIRLDRLHIGAFANQSGLLVARKKR